MEEDLRMATVLPSSFLSKHEGFLGTIKNFTRDFIVTEIDIHGQLVTKAEHGSLTSQLQEEDAEKHHNYPKRPKIDELTISSLTSASGKATTVQGDIDQVKHDSSELLTSETFDLGVILGPTVSEALELFTTALRLDGNRGAASGDCQAANGHLSLGIFADKAQRAGVHRAVRHNYPFLMTITNQAEILVKENPDFKKLSSLVSEEECEDFFRFIDEKVSASTFTFRPDASKEHRTSVHHFLAGRFGKLVETKSFTNENGSAITVRLRDRGKPRRKRKAADAEREEDGITYTGERIQRAILPAFVSNQRHFLDPTFSLLLLAICVSVSSRPWLVFLGNGVGLRNDSVLDSNLSLPGLLGLNVLGVCCNHQFHDAVAL